MMLSSSLLPLLALTLSLVTALPNVPSPVVGVPSNAINDPTSVSYSTATLQNTTNMMATLMSYLYGSLMPALMAQQQRSNTTTAQDPASVPSYPLPSYYSYSSTYPAQPAVAPADVTVNERISRAAPTENSVTTDAPPPKNLETLPLDIIKHAVQHKDTSHNHHHQHKKTIANVNSTTTTTTRTAAAVELPIACPKCGAKMKLIVGLTSAEAQPHDFCSCDDAKPRYSCECVQQPQICALCNKIRKYPTDFWKPQQQQQSVIVLRKANPTTPRRNVFTAPAPTTVQPSSNGYDGSNYLWAPAVEPAITKRYAVLPSSENVVYAGGYEQQQQQQQQQQELSSIINAVYEAVEHEPTCYCWRCRFIRRY